MANRPLVRCPKGQTGADRSALGFERPGAVRLSHHHDDVVVTAGRVHRIPLNQCMTFSNNWAFW